LALIWPLKKVAALASLAVTFAYLAISGFDVAAQRSFIMLAVVLTAVVLDRPALTMRSVALSALVILAVAPESLMLAGFQMSFAGTIALIAGVEGLRGQSWWHATQTDPRWRFAKPVLAVFMTSLVAGAATAPYSAYHFNMLAQFGLLANMLAMPAMALVVMPAAVVALFLAPLGLDWLAFKAMGWGIGYVLAVATFVADLDGAATGVPAGPPVSLGLLSLGGLFVALWTGRGRWAGLAPVAAALLIWAGHARPDVVISDDGRLFGYMTPAGRVLSSARGGGYAAASWLEDDGDTASQAEAYARGGLPRRQHRIAAEVPGLGTILYVGASDAATAATDCAAAAVLIAPNWQAAPEGRCLFVGPDRLRRDGALAIRITPDGPVVTGALALSRGRPWTRDRAAPPEPQPAPPSTETVSALTP
jgi:competence protein ComEC